MTDSRRGSIVGTHAGGARNGMPERPGYDVHAGHDADEAAADEAIVRAHELRQEAMRRLGVTQADIDAARAEPQPRTVERADVVEALTCT